MKHVLRWLVVLFLIASSVAQTTSAARPKKKAATPSALETTMKEFVAAMAEQQKRIDALEQDNKSLRDEMQKRDAALEQVKAAASAAQAKADQVASQASQEQQTVAVLGTDVTDLKQNTTNVALSLQDTQKSLLSSMESPVAMHFKGITITPGGFLAAETVWRSHALGSDINTPFNSIPFTGATAGHLSEFFASGRQSRVTMLAESKLGAARLSGYVEGDFLSAGITST